MNPIAGLFLRKKSTTMAEQNKNRKWNKKNPKSKQNENLYWNIRFARSERANAQKKAKRLPNKCSHHFQVSILYIALCIIDYIFTHRLHHVSDCTISRCQVTNIIHWQGSHLRKDIPNLNPHLLMLKKFHYIWSFCIISRVILFKEN